MAQIKKQKARRLEQILQTLKRQLKQIHIGTSSRPTTRGILSQVHGYAAARPALAHAFEDASLQGRVTLMIQQVERQMLGAMAV